MPTSPIPQSFKINLKDIPSPEYHQIADSLGLNKEYRCQVWWVDVDVFDGEVRLAVREAPTAPWTDVPYLTHIIDDEHGDGSGSVTFVYVAPSGIAAALYIDPGTAGTGVVKSYFTPIYAG